MLTSAFVNSVVLYLGIEEVIAYLLRGKAPACVIQTNMKDDVSDSVWSVDYRDVVDGFGSGKTQEANDFCVGFEAREV